MSFVTKLTSKIRFWTGGPILRNASGVIEARNAADSAYAIVRGATAVGNSDLAPKAYVDTAIDTDITAALLSNVEVRTVQLAYTDTGDNNIAAAVPDGAICAVVLVQVTTTFDGTTPVLKVGDSGDDDRFMLTTDSDLGTAGLYQKATIYTFSGATQLVANLTIGGSPSQGACDIVVLFARAAS